MTVQASRGPHRCRCAGAAAALPVRCTAVVIIETSWDDPDGTALRVRQRAELDARYGCDDHEPGPPPSASDVDVFLLARDADGTALGCGALRALDGRTGEIKRMYVEPAARGTGVATAILRGLEDRARARGWTELRLETGTAQPDSIRFYLREGYREIPLFGVYVGSSISRCFARTL